MISNISNAQNISQIQNYQPQISKTNTSDSQTFEPLNSFADEDEAIISSQAKMLNELDKFNSNTGNEVDLAESEIMAKFTTNVEVSVINTKTEMMDAVLNIGE